MLSEKSENSLVAVASFSLYPMSNNFVEIIENALGETDTSNVWMKTDDVSTTARGKIVHVFDVTKSICVHAAKTGEHVSFQATYSLGCPGDKETDRYIALDNMPSNSIHDGESNLYAAAKFALYPLGSGKYMETIYEKIDLMKQFITVTSAHSSTKLSGGIIDIFKGLEHVFQTTVTGDSHTVMTVNMSINSPSHKNID